MKRSKVFFYVRHLLELCLDNKLRFFLSVIGLLVGLFVFTTGNILLDSYYNETMKDARQISPGTVALRYEYPERLDEAQIYAKGDAPVTRVIFSEQKSMIYAKRSQNGTLCALSATVAGVSGMEQDIPILSTGGEMLTGACTLLKGRLINGNDVAMRSRVVVIDAFTESLLFPDGNSIGKSITFDVSIPGITTSSTDPNAHQEREVLQCTVVGVISNSYHSDREAMEYQRFSQGADSSVQLESMVYTPLSFVDDAFEPSALKLLIWDGANSPSLKEHLTLYRQQSLKNFPSYDVLDKSAVLAQTITRLAPLKLFLTLMMLLLLFISGINAMNTMFFSIKERIREIGIKKALGATKLDILNQFILEGMMMALIAAVIAVVFSCLTVLFIQGYLNQRLFLLFEVHFTLSNLLLPIFVALLYGFVFSVIPCYYGAMIKVTDSLRFE